MADEHPNLALVHRLWDAGARGDADAIAALYAPDVVIVAHGAPSVFSGEFKGSDELLDYLAGIGESVDDLRSDLLDVYTNDRGAVVRYRIAAARGPKRLDMQFLYLLEIANGRIVEATIVPSDQRVNDEFWRTE
jgi:ketosteroid isomerase-like protein